MNSTAGLSKAKRTKRVFARAIACGMLLMVLPSCRIPFLRHPEQGLGIPPSFPEPATGSIPSLGGKIGGTLGAAIGAVTNGVPGGALDGAMSGAFSTAIRATINAETSQENSSQLSVDAFYNDPVLSQLIYQSVSGNRELRALEEEVQIARADILRRRGAYLPFVTFGARAGLEKPSLFMPDGAAEDQLLFPPGRHFPDPIGNFLASFNLFWQLDIWRELRNARDAAIQRYIAAIEKRNAFVTRLVAEVAENYFELMALDMRLVTLDQIIEFQQGSLRTAQLFFETGRGDDLAVQRFQAEVRKNQSEKLIVRQEIVQAENRINFLVGRFPQPVERLSARFYGLTINALNVGVPAQLLQNRPDIRQAERELAAAGLDVRVARARFFPRVDMIAGIGYQAFNPRYLFNPDALIANLAGELVAPVINKSAIKADYLGANAQQLESLYNYQKVIINAFTEVVNRVSMVENLRKSLEFKSLQLQALDAAVDRANRLFQTARIPYLDVLTSQRDLLDARTVFINTKRQQLSAVVNAYQALGGGDLLRNTVQMPQQRYRWFFFDLIKTHDASPCSWYCDQNNLQTVPRPPFQNALPLPGICP